MPLSTKSRLPRGRDRRLELLREEQPTRGDQERLPSNDFIGAELPWRRLATAAEDRESRSRWTQSFTSVLRRSCKPRLATMLADCVDGSPGPARSNAAFRRRPNSELACASLKGITRFRALHFAMWRTSRSFLQKIARGEWPRSRGFAAADRGPTSIRSEGFTPLGYPVDATLRFPSAQHVPARRPRSTSAATSIVGTSPSKASSSPTPAARARGRAKVCPKANHGMPVACRNRAPEVHGCPCSARECEPRSKGRLAALLLFPLEDAFRHRRAYAGQRFRAEEFDATSNRAPARKNRRAPFVVEGARCRGMESTRHHCAFDRGSPST